MVRSGAVNSVQVPQSGNYGFQQKRREARPLGVLENAIVSEYKETTFNAFCSPNGSLVCRVFSPIS